jgi:ADP-ribosylglycohydrolase
MDYVSTKKMDSLADELKRYLELKAEYGTAGLPEVAQRLEESLAGFLAEVKDMPIDEAMAAMEPNGLDDIKALRPEGARVLGTLDVETYKQRLMGALVGRMAGCTLGAPVEFWSIDRMEKLAKQNGTPFPPVDYWTYVDSPFNIRYLKSKREAYTRDKMDGVPVDDDVEYTLTGLVVVEKYGLDFTTADVGATWQEVLPMACTAERIALENLKKGIDAMDAGLVDNPYCEWIGADIRCDPWAYMCPGHPERAAEFAHRDAYLSHRRQGIYGEMYFAASIAAAFTLDDPMAALEAGLAEIPADCAMAKAVQWALETAPSIKGYRDARDTVAEKFKGMHDVHTINNACLTIFGIALGKTDFTRVIGETVAMGLDNDCTAATAASLVGAVIGIDNIPAHWHARFNDKVLSYSKICESYSIEDLVNRFAAISQKNDCLR